MKKYIYGALILAISFLSSCGSKSEDNINGIDNDSTTIQSAIGQLNSVTSSTENANAMSVHENNEPAQITPQAACSYSTFTCTGATKSINWGSCTARETTLTGGWTEQYSSAGCCSSFSNGCTLTRTTPVEGSTIKFSNEFTLVTRTENHIAFDGTNINGALGTTVAVSGTNRSIAINGIQRVFKTKNGTTIFDHSVVTTTPIVVTGSKAAANRTIQSGAMKVYHNLAQYHSTITFSALKWEDANCCYPTSGAAVAAFGGGTKTGSATLLFSSTCGLATMSGTSGTTAVTLAACE